MTAYDWIVTTALVSAVAALVVAAAVVVFLFHIIGGAFALLSILSNGGISA